MHPKNKQKIFVLFSPFSEYLCEFLQDVVEGPLEVVEDGGHVVLETLPAHHLEHLLQFYSQLLDVVHQDTRLQGTRTAQSINVPIDISNTVALWILYVY